MPRAVALSLIALLLLTAGCGRRDPLERTVSAPTSGRFAAWRAHLSSDSNVELVRRVEEAVQEIRLSVSGARELQRMSGEEVTGGAAAIDEAVRQRVDGRSLREIVRLGYELRLRRLKMEMSGLEAAMEQNSRLVTRPGDLESQHHLEGLHDRQQVRVDQYREDIAAAERELADLDGKRSDGG